MKKKLYYYAIMMLLIALGSCQINEPSLTNNMAKQVDFVVKSEQIAMSITTFSDNLAIVYEIQNAVAAKMAEGDDEHVSFKDLGTKPNGFNALLQQMIKGQELVSFLANNDLEIYWPYSENWDKQTSPTITFTPLDSKTENIGFVKENDTIKQVLVNMDYADKNPVWIVRKRELLSRTIKKEEPTDISNTKQEAASDAYYFKIMGTYINKSYAATWGLFGLLDERLIKVAHTLLAGTPVVAGKPTLKPVFMSDTATIHIKLSNLGKWVTDQRAELLTFHAKIPIPLQHTFSSILVGDKSIVSRKETTYMNTSVGPLTSYEIGFGVGFDKTKKSLSANFNYSVQHGQSNSYAVTTFIKFSGASEILHVRSWAMENFMDHWQNASKKENTITLPDEKKVNRSYVYYGVTNSIAFAGVIRNNGQ